MWSRLAGFVLKHRLVLLLLLLAVTIVMGFFASRVKLSYDFSKAIPADNPKYVDFLAFKEKFGDDGNLIVIGVQTDSLFQPTIFAAYQALLSQLKQVKYVEEVLSVGNSVYLLKDTSTQKLIAKPVFTNMPGDQAALDSSLSLFYALPFYRSLLYNPDTRAYLMAVRINKDILNSKSRVDVVDQIVEKTNAFTGKSGIPTHISGLPLIRTQVAQRIAGEMKWFIIGSFVLSALILLLMFRSVSTMMLSLLVVMIGVVWSVGLIYLFGYKITLLTALIPPLVVVIGIPNCIYFLNKYHTNYKASGDKQKSLIDMVSKMGVVTLFCNLTAAIGFGVFALTESAILVEFGQVAGVSIMLIFVISFILLPAALSYMKAPRKGELNYLNSRLFTNVLLKVEHWVIHHKKFVYAAALVIVVFSVAGIFRLKTEGFIVDDLPKTDKIYADLKFFEKNFGGVMPLEIMIETKKRYGLAGSRILPVLTKMDSLSMYINDRPELSRPLSIAEGIKFVKQGFYEGDSANYALPNSFDASFVSEYLRPSADSGKPNELASLLKSFIDTARRTTRMSVNMADVGTSRLPLILDDLKQRSTQLFDTSKYQVTFTGSTITFLEGSTYIINGLKESIFWAFLLIALCMLYLFRSFKILFCSLIPNVIPLLITAGVMGWAGIRLKPSTVLIFSVALGIAIDVTIRFLVNYKQELPSHNYSAAQTVPLTIRHTGLSILYTSLVLIAGFVIFCFSGFGGTQSLGWLTGVTLFAATLTNLIVLPVLLLEFDRKPRLKEHNKFPEELILHEPGK